jgi:hypothetical protein
MPIRRLPLVLLALVLPALALVACDDAEPETLTTEEARALVENLPDGMRDVEQVKFEVRATFQGLDQIPPEQRSQDGVTIDPSAFGMVFNGGLDVPGRQGHMRFEMTGLTLNPDDPAFQETFGEVFAGASPEDFGLLMEMMAFEDRAYMRGLFFSIFTGAPPAQWVRLDDEDDGFSADDDAIDPIELVSFIDAIEGDIEVVGNEEVRGAEATHVRFHASIGALDELLGGDFGTFAFDETAGPLPVDAWIDTEGRLHRVEVTGPVGDSLDLGFEDSESMVDYDISGTMALWLWDYNKPLDLDAPSDDEVVDADDLEGGLFGAFDEESTGATELTGDDQRYSDLMIALYSNIDGEQMTTLQDKHPDLAARLDDIMVNADGEVTPEELAELEDLILDIEDALGIDIPDAP